MHMRIISREYMLNVNVELNVSQKFNSIHINTNINTILIYL